MLAFPQLINFGNDFVKYSAALTIWHNQQVQDEQNAKSHDEYQTAAANWQVQNASKLAYNQPLLPPLTPPKKVAYNDDGTTTLTDFPDLAPTVMPVTTPSGSIVSPPAMDRTDAILMIVTQILNIINKPIGGK